MWLKPMPDNIGTHTYTSVNECNIMDNINDKQDKSCTLANKMCIFKIPLKIKRLAINIHS